jgi:hypothetical protein
MWITGITLLKLNKKSKEKVSRKEDIDEMSILNICKKMKNDYEPRN